MELLPSLLFFGVFAAFVARHLISARRHRDRWEQAARLLKARYIRAVMIAQDELRGVAHGLYYTYRREPGKRPSAQRAVLRLSEGDAIPPRIRIERARLLNRLVGTRIKTGDAGFDELYDLEGDRAILLAILDTETRRELALAPAEIRIEDNTFEAHLGISESPHDMAERVNKLAALAALFKLNRQELVPRLFTVLSTETLEETRRNIYLELLRVATGDERLRALELGLEHTDRKIRIFALEHLDGELADRAVALLRSPKQPSAVRAAAIRALANATEPNGAELAKIASNCTDELLLAILEVLGDRRDDSQRTFFVAHLAHKNADIRAAAAAAMGRTGNALDSGHLSLIAVDENQGAVSLANGPGALSVTSSDSSDDLGKS